MCECRGFLTPSKCWHIRKAAEHAAYLNRDIKLSVEDERTVIALLREGNATGAIVLVRERYEFLSLEEAEDLIGHLEIQPAWEDNG